MKDFFENKKILILGYGREGKSTHKYLLDNNINCEIYISDQRDISNELIDFNAKVISPDNYLKDFDNYDLIMKTPGIAFKDINLSDIKYKITSQTELFIKKYRNQMIGITGTKGKSTTTTLIYNLFKEDNKDVIIAGNIGIPFFDEIKNINKDTIIVAELSCHQLENINVSPKNAVLLNIYEEHLDHYNDFQNYIDAKMNIVNNQKDNDICYINSDNVNIMNNLKAYSNIIKISCEKSEKFHVKQNEIYEDETLIFSSKDERYIKGQHNLYNIAVLFAVAENFNINYETVKKVIKDFKGLPHRMEFIRYINGVPFYNDSISTIVESTIADIETLDPDCIIVGGMNRGIDYSALIDKIEEKNIKVICMNEVGQIIFDKVNVEKYKIDDMKEVVKKAAEISKRCCVLAPAAPSYGFYKNFEERGSVFKEEVNKY